jgi:hypothetical protein
MLENVWTVTNTNKLASVACLTVLPALLHASATVGFVEIDADTTSLYSRIGSLCDDLKIVTDPDVARWVKFQGLRRRWIEERGASASVAEMAVTPAYQSIVGMGPNVIPVILTQLRSEGDKPDHWFWALAAITRDNPVPPQSRGKVREMAKAWLEWGQKNDYVQMV